MPDFTIRAASAAAMTTGLSALKNSVGSKGEIAPPWEESWWGSSTTPPAPSFDANDNPIFAAPDRVEFLASLRTDMPQPSINGLTITPRQLGEGGFSYPPIAVHGSAEPVLVAPSFPTLSRRQLLLGLLSLGVTEAQIYQVISAMPDKKVGEAVRIEFENDDVIHRDHPLVNQIAALFNLTTSQVDTAWMAATHL